MIKQLISQLSFLGGVTAMLYFSFASDHTIDFSKYSTQGLDLKYTVKLENNLKSPEFHKANYPFSVRLGKSYVGFKEALAFKESQGNYFTVNNYGYLGKYQFGKETLKLLGVYNHNQFLYNPELQEKALIANMQRNKWVLRRYITWYVGKRIKGTVITESGILAAAHLAGPGNVKKYLKSYGLEDSSDAFGTSVNNYMTRFSGYDTSFIIPNKKAKVSKV